MRRIAGFAGLLVLGASSITLAAGGPTLFDGRSLEDTLDELRAEAGVAPGVFHYHVDIEASPAKPEAADPGGGASGLASFTLPIVKRTSSIAWDERPASWRRVALSAKAVRIDFALSQRVFVSPQLSEPSCRWHAAFRHELEHTRRFSQLFVESIPVLKASLEAEAASLNLPSPTAPTILKEGEASRLREAAAERLSLVLERHAAVVLAKMDAERQKPEEAQAYARLFNVCSPRVASGASLDQSRAKAQLLVP